MVRASYVRLVSLGVVFTQADIRNLRSSSARSEEAKADIAAIQDSTDEAETMVQRIRASSQKDFAYPLPDDEISIGNDADEPAETEPSGISQLGHATLKTGLDLSTGQTASHNEPDHEFRIRNTIDEDVGSGLHRIAELGRATFAGEMSELELGSRYMGGHNETGASRVGHNKSRSHIVERKLADNPITAEVDTLTISPTSTAVDILVKLKDLPQWSGVQPFFLVPCDAPAYSVVIPPLEFDSIGLRAGQAVRMRFKNLEPRTQYCIQLIDNLKATDFPSGWSFQTPPRPEL